MKTDYSADVARLYETCRHCGGVVSERYVVQAGVVVERLTPPRSAREAFSVLSALNLLNTAVKQPLGRSLVGYGYIKGMASAMYVWLARRRLEHVSQYYDAAADVVYFRVLGVQLSFHHVPLYEEMRLLLGVANVEVQQWDGLRLQLVALPLYLMANTAVVRVCDGEEQRVRQRLLHFRKPDFESAEDRRLSLGTLRRIRLPVLPRLVEGKGLLSEDKMVSLRLALRFNLWHTSWCTLYRRKDGRLHRLMRYDGHNYLELMHFLVGCTPNVYFRPRASLTVGKLYHLSPRKRVSALSPSEYVMCVAQNSYLVSDGHYSNLLLTYGIALYLARLFPALRFVSTLSYCRRSVHRVCYTYRRLLRVPERSPSRRLKVWLPVDPEGLLRHFSAERLPPTLVREYLDAEDYYQEFEPVWHRGLVGICAYRWHHILKPEYERIDMVNYHARVMRPDGKWAVFSLNEERFITEFVYDRIWFDPVSSIVYGSVAGSTEVLYRFFGRRPRWLVSVGW